MKHQSLILSLALALPLINTAQAEVSIPIELPRDGRTSLAIYDQDGRMVRTLLTGRPLAKGEHIATWDGLDRYGNALPSGDYTWKLLHRGSSVGVHHAGRAECGSGLGEGDGKSPGPERRGGGRHGFVSRGGGE